MYSISILKDETIANMGFWDVLDWQWNFFWRNFFQWELDHVKTHMDDLQEVQLPKDSKDKNWWHFNLQGGYSVKCFVRAWWSIDSSLEVWKGFAPPRAKRLMLFILYGKLKSRKKMRKLNLMSTNEDSFPFCIAGEETIQHIFLRTLHVFLVCMGRDSELAEHSDTDHNQLWPNGLKELSVRGWVFGWRVGSLTAHIMQATLFQTWRGCIMEPPPQMTWSITHLEKVWLKKGRIIIESNYKKASCQWKLRLYMFWYCSSPLDK